MDTVHPEDAVDAVDGVDVVDAVDAVTVVDMVDEADAVGTADAVDAVDVGDPVDPVDPAEPVDAVDTVDTVDSVDVAGMMDEVDVADTAATGGEAVEQQSAISASAPIPLLTAIYQMHVECEKHAQEGENTGGTTSACAATGSLSGHANVNCISNNHIKEWWSVKKQNHYNSSRYDQRLQSSLTNFWCSCRCRWCHSEVGYFFWRTIPHVQMNAAASEHSNSPQYQL